MSAAAEHTVQRGREQPEDTPSSPLSRASGAPYDAAGYLERVRRVAARVGIDARYVDAAAAGIGPVESKPGRRFLFGGPSSVEVSRVLEATDRYHLGDARWHSIVLLVNHAGGGGRPHA